MVLSVEIKSGREWVKRGANATMCKFGTPKKPLSDATFRRLLVGRHSPIEEYEVWVDAVVPERVHTHVVRHKELSKYVATSRPDIPYGKALEEEMRPLSLRFNAKRLIEIMWVRLCNCSWGGTISLFAEIRYELIKLEPMFKGLLAPSCMWFGFCPEHRCCGYNRSEEYEDARELITGESNAQCTY